MALYPYTGTVAAGASGAGELLTPFEFGYTGSGDASDAIEAAVLAGEGLFFPPGTYELHSTTYLGSTVENVILRGVGKQSRLVVNAASPIGRAFWVDGAKGVTFSNLLIEGRGAIAPSGLETECAVYGDEAEETEIENCWFTNFAGYVVNLAGQKGARVRNSWFYDNHSISDSFQSGDILINGSSTQGESYDVVITGNHCNSNNKTGITLNIWVPSAIVSNNFVISRMSGGAEPALQTDFKRKEGITLVYSTTALDNAEKPWSVACNGNVVRNVRWSGIYVQHDNSATPGVLPADRGINASICGNVIERAVMDFGTGDALIHAGIFVSRTHSATIVGNIIKDTNVNGWSSSTALMEVRGIRYLGWPHTSGTARDAVTIQGNIVEHVVNGHGIEVYGQFVPTVVSGNIITDAMSRCLQIRTNGAARGECTIAHNVLKKTRYLEFGPLCWVVAGDRSERIAQKPIINGNRFVVTADITATRKELLYLDIDRGVITNNYFQGTGTHANGGIGIVLTTSHLEQSPDAVVIRRDNFQIANNKFADLITGIDATLTSYVQHTGPLIDQGSTFENVATPYKPTVAPIIYPGQVEGANVTVRASTTPTKGTWRQGDRWFNTVAIVGQRTGQVCTAGGTVGTWVNLPNL